MGVQTPTLTRGYAPVPRYATDPAGRVLVSLDEAAARSSLAGSGIEFEIWCTAAGIDACAEGWVDLTALIGDPAPLELGNALVSASGSPRR